MTNWDDYEYFRKWEIKVLNKFQIIDDDHTELYRIETVKDILLTSEGLVHFNTFYLNRNNRK